MSSNEFHNQKVYSGAVSLLRHFYENGVITEDEFIRSEQKIRVQLSPVIPIVSCCIDLN